MTAISGYEKLALAATGVCVLLCAGVLLGLDGGAKEGAGYRISAQPVSVTVSADGEDKTPDSLLPGERININTAPALELERLPGIGESRAAEIVAHREQTGRFQDEEDLMLVSGIGEVTFEKLRDYITVD